MKNTPEHDIKQQRNQSEEYHAAKDADVQKNHAIEAPAEVDAFIEQGMAAYERDMDGQSRGLMDEKERVAEEGRDARRYEKARVKGREELAGSVSDMVPDEPETSLTDSTAKSVKMGLDTLAACDREAARNIGDCLKGMGVEHRSAFGDVATLRDSVRNPELEKREQPGLGA